MLTVGELPLDVGLPNRTLGKTQYVANDSEDGRSSLKAYIPMRRVEYRSTDPLLSSSLYVVALTKPFYLLSNGLLSFLGHLNLSEMQLFLNPTFCLVLELKPLGIAFINPITH